MSKVEGNMKGGGGLKGVFPAVNRTGGRKTEMVRRKEIKGGG